MDEDAPDYASFAWSFAREQTTFAAPNLSAPASGSALRNDVRAAQLTLRAAAGVALPVPLERSMRPDALSGFVTAAVPAAPTYKMPLLARPGSMSTRMGG
jgi:hypothetical protein